MTTSKRVIPIVWVLAASMFAESTLAQEIRGQVLNRTTGVPVPAASMLLLNESGHIMKMAITDGSGFYSVIAPSPGNYTFRIDAPGYNRHDEPQFSVLAGRILELEIRMWDLTELPPVVVTAESTRFSPGPLEGFYERMERGRGVFIDRDQIEMRAAGRFTDVLRGSPAVDVVPLGNGYYTIRIKGVLRTSRDCPPVLWVDNVRWGSIDLDDGPDRNIFPHELEGIEVYRPTAVPMEFDTMDASCGAVVVWTRRSP